MLSELTSLVKKRKRVGRGGSRGGTCGKGHKGQKARSGGSVHPRFEGGQMPLTRRIPKRGFTNAPFKTVYEIVNLAQLDKYFIEGSTVNKESLKEFGIIKGNGLLKVLANGEFNKKLLVYVDAISKTAHETILNKGGEVHLTKE
jgi:large subunit ribosomal protein L15